MGLVVELLQRQRNGELHCDFPLIVSDHADAKRHKDFFNVPFVHTPVAKENKAEPQQRQIALLYEHQIDLVLLAPYMWVLSGLSSNNIRTSEH